MNKNTEKNANKILFNIEIRAKGALPFLCFVCGCSGKKRSYIIFIYTDIYYLTIYSRLKSMLLRKPG